MCWPRDAVDEAIRLTGKGAKRSDGKLPPHVMVYFAMAMALFAEEDYEEVIARLTYTLSDGVLGSGVLGADQRRDHPGPPAARARTAGRAVLAGGGAGGGSADAGRLAGIVAVDGHRRVRVGCARHAAERGGVRVRRVG